MAEIPVIKPSLAIEGNLLQAITNISDSLLVLVGIVAVLFLIIGGFQFIVSAGNSESIKKARNTVLYTIIGVLVTILAYSGVQYTIESMFKNQ